MYNSHGIKVDDKPMEKFLDILDICLNCSEKDCKEFCSKINSAQEQQLRLDEGEK